MIVLSLEKGFVMWNLHHINQETSYEETWQSVTLTRHVIGELVIFLVLKKKPPITSKQCLGRQSLLF